LNGVVISNCESNIVIGEHLFGSVVELIKMIEFHAGVAQCRTICTVTFKLKNSCGPFSDFSLTLCCFACMSWLV